MAADPSYGLLVKDIAILACRQGMDWWLSFREHHEPSGRIQPIPGTATPQGDHCWVRCDGSPEDGETSRAHAEWLRDHMVSRGVPKSAVLVKRTPKAAGE
jgi:hypothetical protein